MADVDFAPSLTVLFVGGAVILFSPGLAAFGYCLFLRQWLIGLGGLLVPGIAGACAFVAASLLIGAAHGWLSHPWITVAGVQLPVLLLLAPGASIWVSWWFMRVARRSLRRSARLA